jgi:hypothetical protein
MSETTIELQSQSHEYRNNKQYIARITGRSSKYTFEREFVGSKWGHRNEHTTATVDENGLFELGNIDRKGEKHPVYRVILTTEDGLTCLAAGTDCAGQKDGLSNAMAIARRMDSGESIDEICELVIENGLLRYRIRTRTKVEAKKASTAVTV